MTERVRPATPDDAKALSGLFRIVFGQKRPEDVWKWKFFDHPVGAWSWVYESEGKIVAHCGATAVRFCDRGNVVIALQLVDFMSHPRHPGGIGGGGVFARTTAAMFDRILSTTDAKLLYGFPGERHRLAGERLLGYTIAGPVGQVRIAAASDDLEIRPLRESDLSRFEVVPSPLHAIRDREYLNWRYLLRPDAQYGIVETKSRLLRKPETVAIVREEEDSVALMEIGGSFEIESLRALSDRLSRCGRDVIGWCSPDHPTTRRLVASGFESEVRDHFLAAAWFRENPEPSRRAFFTSDPPAGEEFYVSFGDYDVH